jgi:hypothetical protein
MHLEVLINGLPEALERFEKNMDFHSYGHNPVRCRQTRTYDIQFDERDLPIVMKNFGLQVVHRAPTGRAFEMEFKESPIRHHRIQFILWWFVKLFGWPFGFYPPEPVKGEPTGEIVPMDNLNIYPIALGKDNVMINKAHGRTEEFL